MINMDKMEKGGKKRKLNIEYKLQKQKKNNVFLCLKNYNKRRNKSENVYMKCKKDKEKEILKQTENIIKTFIKQKKTKKKKKKKLPAF